MVLACIVTFIASIWWTAVLLNRTDSRRLHAEFKLQKAHDELEIRVEKRTAELQQANEALSKENAERRKAEARLREQAEEKRRLEEQFLRAQRMETIGALAGGVAHDLKNALVPVLMASELMRETAEKDPEQKNYLDLIATSGRRATELVKQILGFARGTRGEAAAVPIRHLISEMTQIARDTFLKSITVQNHTAKDLWSVRGDAMELRQVLMNLCVNARDAMPQGGSLTLEAQNITLTPEGPLPEPGAPPGPYVLLSIKDTGTGINPEILPRIFEPFFTTKPAGTGTGLGLSTAQSILKRQNGFIEVRTELGKGTEFRVYLPAIIAVETKEDGSEPTTLPVGQGELILLVDDEQMVLELSRTTLESYGYEVMVGANGLEAIAIFEAHQAKIKLVIIDMDMPFLDGPGAIKRIRKVSSRVPIILASAMNLETEIFVRMADPGTTRLTKPYGVHQLISAVAKRLAEGPIEVAPQRRKQVSEAAQGEAKIEDEGRSLLDFEPVKTK
jgi:signal transduction histidine kinase/DNA-binding NarL/FixJ family response regulator